MIPTQYLWRFIPDAHAKAEELLTRRGIGKTALQALRGVRSPLWKGWAWGVAMLAVSGGVMALPDVDVVGGQTRVQSLIPADATIAFAHPTQPNFPPPWLAASPRHPFIQTLWRAILSDLERQSTHWPGQAYWEKKWGCFQDPGWYPQEKLIVLQESNIVAPAPAKTHRIRHVHERLARSGRLYFYYKPKVPRSWWVWGATAIILILMGLYLVL